MTALDEQQFWARMNFRQFAALILRMEALWLLWYALLDLTYLPDYFESSYAGHIVMTARAIHLILRIALHVAAAVFVIRYADKILSWLIRDWIRNQPAAPKSP